MHSAKQSTFKDHIIMLSKWYWPGDPPTTSQSIKIYLVAGAEGQ
jgi:hypothetical protein